VPERKPHLIIDPTLRKEYAASLLNRPLKASDERLKRVLHAIFDREPKDISDGSIELIKMAILKDAQEDVARFRDRNLNLKK
jgi:hypothetical protein